MVKMTPKQTSAISIKIASWTDYVQEDRREYAEEAIQEMLNWINRESSPDESLINPEYSLAILLRVIDECDPESHPIFLVRSLMEFYVPWAGLVETHSEEDRPEILAVIFGEFCEARLGMETEYVYNIRKKELPVLREGEGTPGSQPD